MATNAAATGSLIDSDIEQDKWLDDANESVKKQAWFMKRALDSGDLNEALKYASAMIDELRTSKLSPKNYYELYMAVTNELRDLEPYFQEEDQSGRLSVVELYEMVQHAGNIIPRLYLLITVGAVYIKSEKAPAKDILFDLVELCRGVQHPMRGLFLRNYLSQMAKDKLPDVNSPYAGNGGTVKDALEFVLQNFDNMNKLWVRMQHQGAVRDRNKRENERRNLRQLVGTNLVRISELEGVDLSTYKDFVLPRLLEQIVNCKDAIAQEYLMDVVIQVFPDDFHLQTLESFLGTCNQLQKTVNIKNIIIALMNRLSNFAKESPENIPSSIDMFPMFLKHSSQLIESSPKMPIEDTLSLQVALVNFASTVYPDRHNYIDHVLGLSVQVLEKTGVTKVETTCIKHVVQLLTLPLESLGLAILNLNSYSALMTFLDFRTRKQVAVSIIDAVNKLGLPLDTPENLDKLLQFISPILKDQDDSNPEEVDAFEFEQEQHKSACLFHLIYNQDTDVQFHLYAIARKHYGLGGDKRIIYSLPPLVFGSLALVKRIHAREEEKADENGPSIKAKKVFGFVHEVATALVARNAELGMRLFLHAAQVADVLGFEPIAYEFITQALISYEEEISDSKAQLSAISIITGTIFSLKNPNPENYDTLATKATQHSAKLLKKPDQCRAVYNCTHLFWAGTDDAPLHRDDKRVLECLQRALKIANSCVSQQVYLFVEILNKYLYFFDRDCPQIKVKFIKGLIALIEENITNLNLNDPIQLSVKQQYDNATEHIKMKQSLEGAVGDKYRAINSETSDE